MSGSFNVWGSRCRATSQSTLGTFQTDYLKFVARHRHPLFYLFHPCLLSFSVVPFSLQPCFKRRAPFPLSMLPSIARTRRPTPLACATSKTPLFHIVLVVHKAWTLFLFGKTSVAYRFQWISSYVGLLSSRLRPPALHFDYSIYLSCSSSYIAAPSPCARPLSCISIQV